MAISLEKLLAQEGFTGRRSKAVARTSSEFRPASEPHYPLRDQDISSSSFGIRKTERIKSDKNLYDLRNEVNSSGSVNDRRPRDNLIRNDKLDKVSNNLTKQKPERRATRDRRDGKRSNFGSLDSFPGHEIAEALVDNEIAEIRAQDMYNDNYSNQIYHHERSNGQHSQVIAKHGRYREGLGKSTDVEKMHDNDSNEHLGHKNSSYKHFKSMEVPYILDSRFNRIPQNRRSFDASRIRRQLDIEETVPEPALDEIAVQAVISILSGSVKCFAKDEEFRTLLRHNCFASLNFIGLEEGINTESKVIASLEQAIETVERAVEEYASAKELKKASLRLSVITGLNANDLKDGFTSGIPNYRLSACAHLYLSVIYMLQKKDRIAAKHILQVFCSSPFQARTHLLPELWHYLFLPHLSHLEMWYNKEVYSLKDTSTNTRKLMLLDKAYSEILDSSTSQFAIYYKGWLTEGVEAPSIPSIHIPSISFLGGQQGSLLRLSSDMGSPVGHFSHKPMVSKKLYDSLFGHSQISRVELEDYMEAVSIGYSIRSSNDPTFEDIPTSTYYLETVKQIDREFEPVGASHPEDELGDCELHKAAGGNEECNSFCMRLEDYEDDSKSHYVWHTVPNELALMTEKSISGRQAEKSADLSGSSHLPCSNHGSYPISLPIQIMSSAEELHGDHENIGRGHPFLNIPQDFICPLTGFIFEDPVTLDSGQTFERAAIREWFKKGNKMCPLTGAKLKCQAVPVTNFILKRVIDSWKSDHLRQLLTFFSDGSLSEGIKLKDEVAVFIIEQLLTAFSEEERTENIKQFISLGGLRFLIQRFQCGNLDEKICVASLLCCCIEVESSCRNDIARNIEKPCLLELLHSQQVKSRRNAVLLLTELICLRWKDVSYFLSGLQNEGIADTMHILLLYLRTCPHEQRPLVAVLLLHLDQLVEPKRHNIYRDESVDAITVALDGSLIDEVVCEKCCRALLILGARFSLSGKVMTEDWILRRARFLDVPTSDSVDSGEDTEDKPMDAEEEKLMEEWLMNLSVSLLSNGKKSFLDAVSKCLISGNLDLIRVCLTTVAWLSTALVSLTDAEFQLSAFSALVSGLKEILETSKLIEHKILVSMSLLNFSKRSECRLLLKKLAEEIAAPLRCLVEVTWTAKELFSIIYEEDL